MNGPTGPNEPNGPTERAGSNGPDPDDAAHDELLARLRRIAGQVDPVPRMAYDLGYAAFELRDVDAQLAELVVDSAVDAGGRAAVRGESPVRLLCFEAGDLSVELEVTERNGRRSLLGQVIGAGPAQVRAQSAGGSADEVPVDDLGRFIVDDVPAGLFRLQVDSADRTVMTSWVRL